VVDGDCDPSRPVCDPASNSCVQCISDANCPTPEASRCNLPTQACAPCIDNAHCAGVVNGGTELGVCDAGLCVQCTGTDFASCSVGAAQRLCNSLQRTCTNVVPATADLCETCLADAHCQTNQLCVQQTFAGQDVGFFCFPRDVGGICPGTQRPFVDFLPQSISIDVVAGDICGLAVTTCPARGDFRAGEECAADSDCGVPGLNDGACENAGGQACTVPCAGNVINCPVGALCSPATDTCE
jgi:hypothetical protein